MGEALGAATDFAREKLHTAKVALGGHSDPERRGLRGREDGVEEEVEEAANEAMAAHLRTQAAKTTVPAGASLAVSALLPVNPVSPVMAALSARSTDHIIGLLEALQRRATDEDKEIIRYAIHQKSKKKLRKTASIAPVVGSVVSAMGLVRWAYKKKKGTLGEERRDYARRLAERLCAADGPVGLSHEIVYALYGNSPDQLKTVHELMGNPDAALHLFYKLRST